MADRIHLTDAKLLARLSLIFIFAMAVFAATAFATTSRSNLLDINTATAAQLDALPGMGPAYVRRVIEGRPYTAKNQLATRGVLPQSEYGRIAPYIVAKHPAH